MKKTKKLLSLLLSLLIVMSSVSVGFFAFAATDDKEKASDKVTSIQTKIEDYNTNNKKYLYSAKEEEKEQKAEARKVFDEISSSIKALTEAEKLEMQKSHYVYWLTCVQDDNARTENGGKSPSLDQRAASFKNLAEIESVMGTLPADYKSAIDALAPYSTDIDGKYLGNNSGLNFKDNELAQNTLKELVDNLGALNETAFSFTDYLQPNRTGGIYANITAPTTDKFGATVKNVFDTNYYMAQDIDGSGSDPRSVSQTNFIQKDRNTGVYSWKSGHSAQTYIDGFNNYYEAIKKDQIAPAAVAMKNTLELVSKFASYKDVADAVNTVVETGVRVVKGDNVPLADVNGALEKAAALSESAKQMYDELIDFSKNVVYVSIDNVYEASELTPELGYTKPTKISKTTSNNAEAALNNVLENLKFEDFVKFVNDTDLDKLNAETIATAKAKYVSLTDKYKKQITDETMAKYMQIVKPAIDQYNFEKEIKEFKKTTIVRPENSEVANTVGGIQSAVDALWDLVVGTLLPMIAPDVDLSEGLDKVLEENVYTTEMVSKIFDLYATLSKSDMDLGMMGLTLGKVIGMIISPSKIANALEEEKFSVAKEKIAACKTLDDVAAIVFENGDFGFKNGDRDGFVDALLAVLRNLTVLFDPDASVLVISVGIKMFDYISEDGSYVNGAYANLIPMLEELGITSIPNAQEYKENYYKVKETSANIAADEFLRPIIDGLFTDLVDMVSPDPLNGLIKVLPRVANLIGTNKLNDCLKGAIAQLGLLSGLGASLDLSADAVNKMITAAPIDLTSVAGKECKIQLKAIDWMKLANCATVESHTSKSNSNAYFILRTGDTDTCFTTVFYYLYDVLFADSANYAAVKTLLNGVLGNLSGMVIGALDSMVALGKEGMYGKILDMLGTPGDTPIEPEDPDKPVDPEDPDKPTDPQDPDVPTDPETPDGDDGDKLPVIPGADDEDTDSPTIPDTGAAENVVTAFAVLVAVSVALATAIFFVMRKKGLID